MTINRQQAINIFFTRFSISNNDKPSYFKKYGTSYLYSPERLKHKFFVFENITVPSINTQIDDNYVWMILYGKELPKEYIERLHQVDIRNAQLIGVQNVNEMFEVADKTIARLAANHANYRTIRLDDDDALERDFLWRVNSYNLRDKEVLSFSHGRRFKIVNGYMQVLLKPYIVPNIALGLTMMNDRVYRYGNHYTINERCVTRYDKTPNMWLVCCSEFCDTERQC